VQQEAPGELPGERIAESVQRRLVEDAALRANLQDDAWRPLLEWSTRRIDLLARESFGLEPRLAADRMRLASVQLLKFIQTINLAVGERETVAPELMISRFQLLDTVLEPPLLDEEHARRAQMRLDALLSWPIDRLQAASAAELVRRLLEIVS
jgi:hypothetical protein